MTYCRSGSATCYDCPGLAGCDNGLRWIGRASWIAEAQAHPGLCVEHMVARGMTEARALKTLERLLAEGDGEPDFGAYVRQMRGSRP